MSNGVKPDIEKLVKQNMKEGGSLDLENRKLGDEGATQNTEKA